MRNFLQVMMIVICLFVAASRTVVLAQTEELTHQVEEISQKVALTYKLLRDRTRIMQRLPLCNICQKEMAARHVLSRARDLEHLLVRFIALHGLEVTSVSGSENDLRMRADIDQIMDSINSKFDVIISLNGLRLPYYEASEDEVRRYDQIYNSLNRLESILVVFGAPITRPEDVWPRVQHIERMLSLLHPEFDGVDPVIQDIEVKVPNDVYGEAWLLFGDLARYIEERKIDMILSIPHPGGDIITPRQVNELTGVIRSDLVHLLEIEDVKLPEEFLVSPNVNVSPTYIWRSLNHSRRLLQSVAQDVYSGH